MLYKYALVVARDGNYLFYNSVENVFYLVTGCCRDIYAVIEREKKKLLRIREAYEAGVDTLEEYKENKKKIQDGIEKLTAQAAEQVPASSKRNAKLISEKVRAGLDIIKNPKSSENDKNIALRHFIEKIVYFKPQNIIEIFYKL